jgi:hypothetical protein
MKKYEWKGSITGHLETVLLRSVPLRHLEAIIFLTEAHVD